MNHKSKHHVNEAVNQKSNLSPIEHLNNLMAAPMDAKDTPRWERYYHPIAELSEGLPAPILGIMVLIWQLRERDLMRNFPLDSLESRTDFISWCITSGRLEYQALSEADIFWRSLMRPAFSKEDYSVDDPAHVISWLMVLIHKARPDINADLDTIEGREKFLAWYLQHGSIELKLGNLSFADWQAEYLDGPSEIPKLTRQQKFLYFSRPDLRAAFILPSHTDQLLQWFERNTQSARQQLTPELPSTNFANEQLGVNVVGYAYGELGIGEDCRMAAQSLVRRGVPTAIIDFSPGSGVSQGDRSCAGLVTEMPLYGINLFCLPALEQARCFAVKGRQLFQDRFNIGYWPWELASWPNEWNHIFALVDEVWTSSEFIRKSVLSTHACEIPVELMPMAVELPNATAMGRENFGLPKKAILFLFIFDLNSSAHRKNPAACLSAFEKAFPKERYPDENYVGLVIKVHKPSNSNEEWQKLKELAGRDRRVHLIEQTLDKADLLALYKVCDVFVSLHRSEGFGRCIAEAMLLGKPVITTNYSGNVDFASSENAMPVSFTLEPVRSYQYLAAEKQVWADADVTHAANHMISLVKSQKLRSAIGRRATATIKQRYSFQSVGSHYQTQLIKINNRVMAKSATHLVESSTENKTIYVKLGHSQNYELSISLTSSPTTCVIRETPLDLGRIWHIDEEDLLMLKKCQAFQLQTARQNLAEVLWLTYHAAPVGAKITNKEGFVDSYFDRHGYYFKKIKKLDSNILEVTKAHIKEALEGVSFCIPTGGDTPELRACVKRIIDIPIKKEIILCGKIPPSFPYLKEVRIVGEDIPFPPVWITRKKNVAVSNAKYSTVAVLHDRVLLPTNFHEIFSGSLPIPVMGIGGLFTLSSDFNLIGRYSDFNVLIHNKSQPKFSYLSELIPGDIGEFSLDSSLMMARSAAFHYYTNGSHDKGDKYVTGSFYITQKELHNQNPLNEALFWEDFEDVEWGLRCERRGIPHIFNSDYYQLTLSVRAMVLPPHNYLDSAGTAYLLPPPWLQGLKNGTYEPDAAQLITAERFLSNFKRFVEQNALDRRLIGLFEVAYSEKNIEAMIGAAMNAVRLVTQGVKEYNVGLLKSIEGLMSATLERTNLGDMLCHATYFNDGFDLWARVSTNYGFTRWIAFLKIPGMIKFEGSTIATTAKSESKPEDSVLFSSCTKNINYLNTIFGLNESPRFWFKVIKHLVGEM